MEKIVSYSLNEDFIQKLADFVDENFIKKGSDLSRLAFVFPGKRPALFLRKALSKKVKGIFFPPKFFPINSFIDYVLSKKAPFIKMPNMESYYIIYALAKNIAPEIIKGREKFSQFLPWAREIGKFINSLDTEDIPADSLKSVQASAAIGYDIPKNINVLLENIIALREAYHKAVSQKNSFPQGYAYLLAAKAVEEVSFDEFDKIIFCGFFYMQKTELKLITHLYKIGKAILIFQGDEDRWPVLKDASRELSYSIKPAERREDAYSLNLYSAFDKHSQVCTVREILRKTKKPESTVIVLPDSASMIPLVSEIGSSVGDFNVSLGYPLRRSSLYSLFEFIVQAQKTKKAREYYAKDYLVALSQPLVKNLQILPSYSATRVLVHKVEEALLGMENTSISGYLFVKLKDVEKDTALFELAAKALKHMDIEVCPEELQNVLKELHSLLFTSWEEVNNFGDFAISLGNLLDVLLRKSFIKSYGLNLKIAERIYSIQDELQNASFSKEDFTKEDIFKIFQSMLENEMIAFTGSPLKGLQILGTLETRSLNFENVIIMDANESILPKLRVREPLIPRDIALNLGLQIMEKEEEIQRYNFTRLISAAKNVHVVYEENPEKEKSRFVEELIWQAEKKKNALNVIPVLQVNFSVNVMPSRREIKKTKEMIDFLKTFRYSASSIDTYVQCPLQFYYHYVLGLEEKEEFQEDPEGKEIGSFIHKLLEKTFRRFINKKPQIDKKFRMEFFEEFDKRFKGSFAKKMKSDSFLLESVMRRRLEQFLDFEETSDERNVQEILYLEEKFSGKIEFTGNVFDFTYIVDRVDRLKDGSILILDYKTGIETLKPQQTKKLEELELKRESIRDRIKSFQMPLYYHFEKKKYHKERLNAALYSLRSFKLAYLHDEKTDIERTMELCLKALDFILHEILDPKKTFAADRKKEHSCTYCSFFYLCR